MNKRNKSRVEVPPYPHIDRQNITIYYQWTHGRDEIVPGDKITFKNVRGKFVFIKVVDNRERGVTWIDCLDDSTKTFRSFYVEKLRSKVKPKRQKKVKIV